MMKFNVCALFYGDYRTYAIRCLKSLATLVKTSAGRVADVRIGLNEVSMDVIADVKNTLRPVEDLVPVLCYVPDANVGKYPLMRKMFHDPEAPTADAVMWFDDDSYVEQATTAWWEQLEEVMDTHSMAGQYRWFQRFAPGQADWIEKQPWCNKSISVAQHSTVTRGMKFCQGGWWVMKTELVKDVDWPWPQLRHCGGDSMLGECLLHKGVAIADWAPQVFSNADTAGKQSGAKRRGMTQPCIGSITNPLTNWEDTRHQEFQWLRKSLQNL